jgi:hypothetical protein
MIPNVYNCILASIADVEFESISNLTATTCPDQQINRYNDTRYLFLPPINSEILLKKCLPLSLTFIFFFCLNVNMNDVVYSNTNSTKIRKP